MWGDGCDNAVDVPQLCDCVLNSHIGANSDFGKFSGMLIVVVFYLFCVAYGLLFGRPLLCLSAIVVQMLDDWREVYLVWGVQKASVLVRGDPAEKGCYGTGAELERVSGHRGCHVSMLLGLVSS